MELLLKRWKSMRGCLAVISRATKRIAEMTPTSTTVVSEMEYAEFR